MAKFNAFGTVLAWDIAGGSSYSTIAQVETIGGPTLARDSIEVTTHDSANAWREFIKGIKDGGEITFDLVYDPALGSHDVATGVAADFSDDSTIPNFRLTFPDTANTIWTLPAFVTGFETSEPFDDKLMASVTIKVAGEPTLA